jgi:hypothetical protein
MEYEDLKREVAEIASIAASVPEQFQEKCFEVLLNRLLGSTEETGTATGASGQATRTEEASGAGNGTGDGLREQIPMQSQVRLFVAKTEVTVDQLARVLMMDGGQVHFIREPSPSTLAAGQIEWALLLALKSAIENNRLETDPEAVRSIVQEKGFYDKANFSSHFKKAKNAALFKGPLEPQGVPQGLTPEGIDALGRLVKDLAGSG